MSDQQQYPFGCSLDEMDVEAFFNMRDWLRKAVEAQGARFTGGGVGMGQADIDIELDGGRFNISIRPLPLYKSEPGSNAPEDTPGDPNRVLPKFTQNTEAK